MSSCKKSRQALGRPQKKKSWNPPFSLRADATSKNFQKRVRHSGLNPDKKFARLLDAGPSHEILRKIYFVVKTFDI